MTIEEYLLFARVAPSGVWRGIFARSKCPCNVGLSCRSPVEISRLLTRDHNDLQRGFSNAKEKPAALSANDALAVSGFDVFGFEPLKARASFLRPVVHRGGSPRRKKD